MVINASHSTHVLIELVDKKTFERRTFPHEYSVLIYTDGIRYYAKNQDGSIICTNSQTACIQESVNYLAPFGGGRILIKRGTYYPQTITYIPYGIDIIIEGEGPSTVFRYTDSFRLFTDSGEPTWSDSVIFRNFTVDRRGSGANKAEIINISFRGYLEFDGITIYDDYRTGGGDFALGGYNNIVAIARRNRIFNKSYGIWLFGFFTHIYDNYVENTADVGIVGAGIIYPAATSSWLRIPPGLWVGGHTVIESNICVDCGQTDEAISIDYMANGQLGDGIGIIRNNLITTKNAVMYHPITVIKVKHAIVEGNEVRGQFRGDLIGSYGFTNPPGSTMYIDVLNNVFDVVNRRDLVNSSSVRSMFINAPLGIKLIGNKFYINYPYKPQGDDVIGLLTSTAIVKNNKIVINTNTPGGLGRHIGISLTGKSVDPDTSNNTAIVSDNYIHDPNQDIWEASIESVIVESDYPNAYIVFENNLLNVKSNWPALGIATGINLTARLIIRNNRANANRFRYKASPGTTLTVHQIDEDQWTKSKSGTIVIYQLNRSSGVATIPKDATSVTVEHGLISKPNKVLVTPLGQPSGSIWVSDITNTSFKINVSSAPTTDLPIAWYAEC
jgi:hypothetical protein